MEAEQCTAASVAVQPPSPARSTRTARTPQSFGCRGACTQSISTWSKLKIPFKFRRMPYAVCRTLFETLQHLDHPSVVAAQHAGIMAGAALIHCLSLECSAAERPPRHLKLLPCTMHVDRTALGRCTDPEDSDIERRLLQMQFADTLRKLSHLQDGVLYHGGAGGVNIGVAGRDAAGRFPRQRRPHDQLADARDAGRHRHAAVVQSA